MHDLLLTLGLDGWHELPILAKVTLRIALLLLLAALAIRFSRRLINTFNQHLRHRAAGQAEELKRIDTVSRVFHYAATILICSIVGVEILHQIGISIVPILTAAGVAGVAIGFGAQSLIRDYFNGFFILLEDQIRQGDYVEAGARSGLVEEVTLRHIRMRDYAGNVHFVPNGNITTVTNMSREFAQAVIELKVAPSADIDQVIAVMQQTADELYQDAHYHPLMLGPLEMTGVEQLDAAAVVLRCRFKVAPLQQWRVRNEFLRRIKPAFERHGIALA